jgi:outer membrane protein
VGLVVSWPLLDFVSLARERTSAELEHVREAELSYVSERLRAAIQTAYATFETARESVPALERQLSAAQANWQQAKARSDAGLAGALELADAEALLTDAEIQLALGRFELARTRARLARVTAEPAPGASP